MHPRRLSQNQERCNLRLSEDLLSSIDAARSARAGFVSRNSWIAEAIHEKLSKEGAAPSRTSLGANNA
jgi:metal-responsive CopG/Arc/MetJ family transcriptional regulator